MVSLNNNISNENNTLLVNVYGVISKIKNRKLLIEFCFNLGFILPNFGCFSHDFVLKWAIGLKKVCIFINYI